MATAGNLATRKEMYLLEPAIRKKILDGLKDIVPEVEGSTALHRCSSLSRPTLYVQLCRSRRNKQVDDDFTPDVIPEVIELTCGHLPSDMRKNIVAFMRSRGRDMDINARNVDGRTPMHVAYIERRMADIFMAFNPDLTIRDEFRRTPLDYAQTTTEAIVSQEKRYARANGDIHFRFEEHNGIGKLIKKGGTTTEKVEPYIYDIGLSVDLRTFGRTLTKFKWHKFNFGLLDELVRDSRGRTMWHDLFLLEDEWSNVSLFIHRAVDMQDIDDELRYMARLATMPENYRSKRASFFTRNCNDRDSLGRTPLHYAAMHCRHRLCDGEEVPYKISPPVEHGGKRGLKVGRKSNVESTSQKSASETKEGETKGDTEVDVKSEKELRAAINCALFTKCCLFLISLESWKAVDCFGRTPLHYACLHGQPMPRRLREILSDNEEIKDIDGYTPRQLLVAYNETRKERLKVGNGCIRHLKNVIAKVDKLEPMFAHCSDNNCEFLNDMWPERTSASEFVWKLWTDLEYTYRNKLAVAISETVTRFMQRLIAEVGQYDRRLTGRLMPVGSAFEGTKIGAPDEFDFNVELVNFRRLCVVEKSAECPAGFVLLKKSSQVLYLSESYGQLFDKDNRFLAIQLNYLFQVAITKILCRQSFWDQEPLLEVRVEDDLYKLLPNKFCRPLHLKFNRPLDGSFITQVISVDIVPVIRMTDWRADGETRNSEGCCLIFDRPFRKYCIPYSSLPFVRVSFARAESLMLKNSLPVVRAAFMIAKQILRRCHVTNVSTYVIKTASLWTAGQAVTKAPLHLLTADDLRSQLEILFRKVYEFSLNDFVPTYFWPSHHVQVWKSEKIVEYAHIVVSRICQGSYRNLFVVNPRYKNISSIGDDLIINFILLFAVCERDESPQWIFPTIGDYSQLSKQLVN